jgi:hypothetical protein
MGNTEFLTERPGDCRDILINRGKYPCLIVISWSFLKRDFAGEHIKGDCREKKKK